MDLCLDRKSARNFTSLEHPKTTLHFIRFDYAVPHEKFEMPFTHKDTRKATDRHGDMMRQ